MMLLVPYHADVVMERVPLANWVIMAVTVAVSLWGFSAPSSFDTYSFLSEPTTFDAMVLTGWGVTGLFGHLFLHSNWLHLLGNMVFLFVFGNAICAKVGNLWFPFVYLGLGLIAAVTHLLFDGRPSLGASGAINGMVAMFLVYYPVNEVSFLWWFIIRAGTFAVSSAWAILMWFAFDLWGALGGGGNVAYVAHLGGFFAGFGLASALLLSDLVPTDRGEQSIYEALKERFR